MKSVILAQAAALLATWGLAMPSPLPIRQERHPQEPSAGSVFKRTAQYPAGFLIDQAGLKERRRGDAQVSGKHANFVVNLGQARASDVRALVEEVQEIVEQRFGVRLELEIELVGEW